MEHALDLGDGQGLDQLTLVVEGDECFAQILIGLDRGLVRRKNTGISRRLLASIMGGVVLIISLSPKSVVAPLKPGAGSWLAER